MPRSRQPASAAVASATSSSSASAAAAAAAAIKTRRSHRKSRNGCAECKRRHIRCDEHKPVCSNCSIAERQCVYPNGVTSNDVNAKPSPPHSHHDPSSSHLQQPPHRHRHNAASPATPSSTEWNSHHHSLPSTPQLGSTASASSASMPCIAAAASTQPGFTMQHLIFLHHAETAMDHGGVGPPDHIQRVVDISARHCIDAPYLMEILLAFSALHLSVLHEEAALAGSATTPPSAASPTAACSLPAVTSLRHQATQLQTCAIANFTRLTAHIAADDKATSVQRFLFSNFLSLHSLADALNTLRDGNIDFTTFTHCFADSIGVQRGVQAVILPIYEYLVESELKPMLAITSDAMDAFEAPRAGNQCTPLLALVDDSPRLTNESKESCRMAIDKLQWCFDMYARLPEVNGPHAMSAFSIMLPAQFVDVLRNLQPEALVILAYYSVLIHYGRKSWLFRDAGVRLIHAISNHLGANWSQVLAWPLHVIETER